MTNKKNSGLRWPIARKKIAQDETYRQLLALAGAQTAAEKWLKRNPVPKEWTGGKWEYAYEEMPVIFGYAVWWL